MLSAPTPGRRSGAADLGAQEPRRRRLQGAEPGAAGELKTNLLGPAASRGSRSGAAQAELADRVTATGSRERRRT
jgi:hypothetical protein